MVQPGSRPCDAGCRVVRSTEKLYGISPTGDVGLLIIHRGALFLAIIVGTLFAIVDPGVRRAMSGVVAVSVLGFLFLYVRAGMPEGALRTIAIVDLVAVVPLCFVAWAAWRG
ncbi:hypothetical protein A9995_14280 [Erythrobacter sp. QSSC1-22B]|uniref:hypothetical protein n=1 Tax=Erythrobacter sp. QSSC1-22B TaxID=1860125 RepID=UPI000806011C|nr:hypothetical protein [Erythrobacter sp. QSSC1-22B]OBX17830.1 hypothetical protein A9995_14280 [Erythrobacter sp. QSSC1-22B]